MIITRNIRRRLRPYTATPAGMAHRLDMVPHILAIRWDSVDEDGLRHPPTILLEPRPRLYPRAAR